MPKVGQIMIGVLETVITGIQILKEIRVFEALTRGRGRTGIRLLNPAEI